MGAWGIGNLENDSAADILRKHFDDWIKEIRSWSKLYSNDSMTVLDIEDRIMTYFELMRMLAIRLEPRSERGEIVELLIPRYLPDRDELKRIADLVRSEHLKYFGQAARESARFKEIDATFDFLLKQTYG